jgi:hypothetical protein
MRWQMVAFFAFVLVICNLICSISDGTWIRAEDQTQMNNLVGYSVGTAGQAAVAAQNPSFFTSLWKAVTWDFSFINHGDLLIIRWILLAITIGVIFAIGQEFRSTITGILGRR